MNIKNEICVKKQVERSTITCRLQVLAFQKKKEKESPKTKREMSSKIFLRIKYGVKRLK